MANVENRLTPVRPSRGGSANAAERSIPASKVQKGAKEGKAYAEQLSADKMTASRTAAAQASAKERWLAIASTSEATDKTEYYKNQVRNGETPAQDAATQNKDGIDEKQNQSDALGTRISQTTDPYLLASLKKEKSEIDQKIEQMKKDSAELDKAAEVERNTQAHARRLIDVEEGKSSKDGPGQGRSYSSIQKTKDQILKTMESPGYADWSPERKAAQAAELARCNDALHERDVQTNDIKITLLMTSGHWGDLEQSAVDDGKVDASSAVTSTTPGSSNAAERAGVDKDIYPDSTISVPNADPSPKVDDIVPCTKVPIKKGQTLSEIVRDRMPEGTSQRDIMAMCQRIYDMNKGGHAVGDDMNMIYAGQKLIIPDDLSSFAKMPKNIPANQLQVHRP